MGKVEYNLAYECSPEGGICTVTDHDPSIDCGPVCLLVHSTRLSSLNRQIHTHQQCKTKGLVSIEINKKTIEYICIF